MTPPRKQSRRARHPVKNLLSTATELFTQRILEARIPDTLEFLTGRLATLMKLPLEDAITETIKMLIYVHSISPKWQKIFIEQIWRSQKLGKKTGSVRDLNRTMIELLLTVLKGRVASSPTPQSLLKNRIRPKNLDIAVFVLAHAVEAAIHAAVLERPELLKDPEFAQELTDLVVRYLLSTA